MEFRKIANYFPKILQIRSEKLRKESVVTSLQHSKGINSYRLTYFLLSVKQRDCPAYYPCCSIAKRWPLRIFYRMQTRYMLTDHPEKWYGANGESSKWCAYLYWLTENELFLVAFSKNWLKIFPSVLEYVHDLKGKN